jgi:hypothetical protein
MLFFTVDLYSRNVYIYKTETYLITKKKTYNDKYRYKKILLALMDEL